MYRISLGLITLLATMLVLSAACRGGRHGKIDLGRWQTTAAQNDDNRLPWISFYWVGDSMGGRWYAKAAMFIPVKLEGLPQTFVCQFDIGSDVSMIYGNPLKPLLSKHPRLAAGLDSALYEGNMMSYLKDLHIVLGKVPYSSPQVYVRQDYGEVVDDSLASADSMRIGTIGVDICADKVLIIDYPARRFCIVDHIPAAYKTTYTDFSTDAAGRPLLNMTYHGKTYKVLFDCGSSAFSLIATGHMRKELALGPVSDSLEVSSWGKMITMKGSPMKDSFTLAGKKFGDVTAYYNDDKDLVPDKADAVTGNALFLNSIIILDFKNRKVGIVQQ